MTPLSRIYKKAFSEYVQAVPRGHLVLSDDIKSKAAAYWTSEKIAALTAGKKWLMMPDEAADLLRAVGLMNKDASISWDNTRKYSQINHMLQLLEGALKDQAARQPRVNILDAGCGTSFLSLAMAWYLDRKLRHPFQIVGFDSNAKVIATSKSRAELIGVADRASFLTGLIPKTSLEHFTMSEGKAQRPNILLALHACDTATDHAIALGIRNRADIIAVAPCCQRELAEKLKNAPTGHALDPVYRSPNLRRDFGATMTDSLRLLHLRAHGYEVTATEFVPSEHTPKNRLLLATRRGSWHQDSKDQLAALTDYIGGHTITLSELLA
jgi:SAM-dependent methyltransferase